MKVDQLSIRTCFFGFLLFSVFPNVIFAQFLACDGTTIPEFYSLYGGSDQFTTHSNDALTTFIEVEEAVASGEFLEAKLLIDDLFNKYPKGDNIWWNVFNDPNGANLGTPHAYYGVRMLEDIVNYNLNPSNNPILNTVNMSVILVGCSQGIQPTTDEEMEAGNGVFVTNTLDESLLLDDYCLIEQSLELFRQYIHAISDGELNVNVQVIELPDLCLDAKVSTTAPWRADAEIGPVFETLDQEVKDDTDWYWLLYPSHVPDFPDFEDNAFITGGMGGDSKGGPVFIIDDKWLVRKPPHLGEGIYNDIERRIYLPQWLQHEFYHHLYRIYPEFSLEVNGHDWFDLNFWPTDFVGRFEADFYAESLHKRIKNACEPLSSKLITRKVELPFDLEQYINMNNLLGAYSLDNISNAWHEGEVIEENGSYFWRNSANVQWKVTPNIAEGILETGPDSPYPGQDFALSLYRNQNGEIVPGVIGLIFQGELYKKRFDLINELAPYEASLGQYITSCHDMIVKQGSIIKEEGLFYWENEAGEKWWLSPNSDDEAFLVEDGPWAGENFEFVLNESMCGITILGFQFLNHYYWLEDPNSETSPPEVLNPLEDLALDAEFGSYLIDLSMVFQEENNAELTIFSSSSQPDDLSVFLTGFNLELTGGEEGTYNICVIGVNEEGGVSTDEFEVQVGIPTSNNEHALDNIVLYPNPTKAEFHISKIHGIYAIEVFDIHANVQLKIDNVRGKAIVDLQELSSGVYYVKIRQMEDGSVVIQKVIKI